MRKPAHRPGGELIAEPLRDKKLSGGGGDGQSVVLGRDLIDADQLRQLGNSLLALVFKRSGVGVGRAGLNLRVEVGNRGGECVDLAGYTRGFLVESRLLRIQAGRGV